MQAHETAVAAAPEATAGPAASWRRIVRVLLLLAGPVVLFVVLDIRALHQLPGVDPWVYTGLISNYSDLLSRLGETYFTTRFGLLVPGNAAELLFGDVAGFFALRYAFALLASIPAYILFARHFGRAGGALAYVLVLSSPLFLRALMWNYVDSAAVPYLFAGTCLLLLDGPRRRLQLVGVGACFALATWSNPWNASLAAIAIVAYVVVSYTDIKPRLLRDLAIIAASGLGVTLTFVAYAGIRFGYWDSFSPNLDAVGSFADGAYDIYLVNDLSWAKTDPSIYLPVLALAAWFVVGSWRSALRFERALVLMLSGSAVWYLVFQLVFGGNPINIFFYFSLLTPGIVLVTALVLVRVWGSQVNQRRLALTAALVVLFPLARNVLVPDLTLDEPWLLALVIVSAAVVLVASRRAPSVRVVAAAAVIVVTLVVTVGQGGTEARYDLVMGRGGGGHELDVFRVTHEVISALPKAPGDPRALWFWYPARGQRADVRALELNAFDSLQSTYHYFRTRITPPYEPGLPHLGQVERNILGQASSLNQPLYLAVLTHRDAGMRRALAALRDAGVSFDEVSNHTFRSGDFEVHLTLLGIPG